MIISRIVVHQPAGLLRILTDAGLEGRCTGVAATIAGANVAEAASILIDANPVNRERIWLAFNEADGSVPADLRACIDVALWDLTARIAGRPVHRHVNGFRNRIPVCRRSERNSAEEIVEEAQEAQGAGFQAYKFDALSDEESLDQPDRRRAQSRRTGFLPVARRPGAVDSRSSHTNRPGARRGGLFLF